MRSDSVIPLVGKRSSRQGEVSLLSRLVGRPDHELAFLPVALEIIERPAPPLPRAISLTICTAVGAALIWSCIGQMDIVANAPGVVIPATKVKFVQAVATANVQAIYVDDGQHVEAGQLLLKLDPASAEASRDKLRADVDASALDVAGLDALARQIAQPGQPLSFHFPEGADTDRVAEQRAAITARYADQKQKLADLTHQIQEKVGEIQEGQHTIEKLQAELPTLGGLRDMYVHLSAEKLASRVDLLQSLQRYSDAEHDLQIQAAHRGEAASSVRSLQAQYEAQVAQYDHDLLKDLSDARRKLAEDTASYKDAVHEVEVTDLRAPVSGTVQQLAVHSNLGVVTAGDHLMVIVPDDRKLIIEAEVNNRDIGFVREGQSVQIKVSAFKFTRYGLVPGKVVSLSRTSTADDLKTVEAMNPEDGEPSTGKGSASPDEEGDLDGGKGSGYVARIALDREDVPTEMGIAHLRPGMAVTAEILTGRRRIISYLLSPIRRYVQDAGKER